MTINAAVIVFPGSNCDRDMATALESLTGKTPTMVWHADSELPATLDLIALPGGFSYGDYLRSGAISARSPIMRAVKAAADKGVYVLGVCNGFQVLTECHMLPGTLMRNRDLHFICKDTSLKVVSRTNVFTSAYVAEHITIPIAHHDGNYFADADTVKALRDNDQIAFTYANNPNGSIADIAGVLSADKRILGMMPHPERAVDAATGGTDGRAVFESLLGSM